MGQEIINEQLDKIIKRLDNLDSRCARIEGMLTDMVRE